MFEIWSQMFALCYKMYSESCSANWLIFFIPKNIYNRVVLDIVECHVESIKNMFTDSWKIVCFMLAIT